MYSTIKMCFVFSYNKKQRDIIWLVVWNIFYFFIQLGRIIPTDEVIFFRGVGIPQTSNGDVANNFAFHTWGASHDYVVNQIHVRAMVKRWTCDGFPFIFGDGHTTMKNTGIVNGFRILKWRYVSTIFQAICGNMWGYSLT